MHYTLHQLKILVEIARQRSVTKAAEALHLTQPAVSIQLKKLQNQFDVPLVEVIGRKLYVTDFGEQVVESAQRILEEVDMLEKRTLAFKGELAGSLSVSAVSTGKYIMPYFLDRFLKTYPNVELLMDVTNKGSVIRHLEKNTVDFALMSVVPANMAVKKEALLENQLYLVGKPGALTKDPVDLNAIPLIYREQGSATRQAMERYLITKKVSARSTMALTSNEAIKQAVMAGLGYSIMPLIGLRNELSNGQIEIIPVSDLPIVTTWYLVWLREKKLSPVASAYLRFIREEKEVIIKENFAWYQQLSQF
jgi:DNA-binding transcriptional LysR family regulator